MNRLTLLLGALLVAIQWPLWLGHGGWLRVWDLQRQLEARQMTNAALRARNQALGAELASLRQGSEAIEERARRELHMMRENETFFQFVLAPGGAQSDADRIASSQALQFGAE
ncbi:MAG TPA: cell division protein FtsB [Burkholderiaceae bacterium]|nr:cell division protein FtsB [Burkholderiaceae bacterium]